MRARLLAVLVSTAALAAIVSVVLGKAPGWLQGLMMVLGVWTLVSVSATVFIVSWFRATARANEALTQTARLADWKGEIAAR